MVEIRQGLDEAASQIGAEKLLLSVSSSYHLLLSVILLMSSMPPHVGVLGTFWISQKWML